MNTVTITVDGVQLPPMKEDGLTVIPHKLWASNSGRNSCTGEFVGDLIAVKYELQLSWEDITDDELAVIDAAVNSLRPFLTVKFCPVKAKGYITRQFYAGDPQYPVRKWRKSETVYGSVNVDLIEK